MKAHALLSACKKVRQTGAANWIATCPAHDDRTPSMTVREMEDGRVLVHCFAGCSVEEILSAAGLSFDALFPDKPLAGVDFKPPHRRPFPAGDVLAACAQDCLHVAVFAANLANGEKITPEDYLAMLAAAGRVAEARRIALG